MPAPSVGIIESDLDQAGLRAGVNALGDEGILRCGLHERKKKNAFKTAFKVKSMFYVVICSSANEYS